MASLSMRLPASYSTPADKTRMVIRTIDGKWIYNVRLAPIDPDYTGLGSSWSEVAVAGRTPFLVKDSFQLKKVSFSLIVTNPSNQDDDMTRDLQVLKALADTTRPIKIAYGGYFESWTWRCTNLEIHSEQRHPSTSKITRATVDLEFTQKNDVADFTGPISGGAKTKSKKGATKSASTKKASTHSSKTKSKTSSKVYIVKQGDTLSGIAWKLFGDVSKWRQLASENKIKNPRLLKIGTRLKY